MDIRMAELSDLIKIEKIYSDARKFMRNAGNTEQWSGGYPARELMLSDINKKQLYVVMNKSVKNGQLKKTASYGRIKVLP